MSNLSIAELDSLCAQMYTGTTAADRQAASQQLDALTIHTADGPHDGSIYMRLMQESQNQYSVTFCAQSLVVWFKQVEKHLDARVKDEVVLTALTCSRRLYQQHVSGGGTVPRHLVSSMTSCVAKLTKIGSEKEPMLLRAINELLRLLTEAQGSLFQPPSALQSPSLSPAPPHRQPAASQGAFNMDAGEQVCFALMLLNGMVSEFNLYDSSKQQTYMNFAFHRRCSNNFRDGPLLSIFEASVRCLELCVHPDVVNPLQEQDSSSPSPSKVLRISPLLVAERVVMLVKLCLTYDFMAIMVDETEEAMSAQFPVAWRDALLSPHVMQVLWGMHRSLHPSLAAILLQGLSSLCGIRRSFFNTPEEKFDFLSFTMNQLSDVESITDTRLANALYCYTVADCCGRYASPFGYRDLSQSAGFPRWMQFCTKLSMETFSTMFGQSGSYTTTSTLLQMWSRLCNSKRLYLGDEVRQRDLEDIVPQLTLAFFVSRTTPWTVEVDQELTEAVLAQCESIPSLCLIDPATTIELLNQHLQNVGQTIVSSPSALGWILYLTGSLIRGMFQTVDESCAPGCARFLQFAVDCATHAANNNSSFHDFVEGGMLHFLSNLQLVFTANRTVAVVTHIIQQVFEDKAKLFRFILFAIGQNLMRDPLQAESPTEAITVIRSSMDIIGEACRDVPPAIMKDLQLSLPPVVNLPISSSAQTYKLRGNLTASLWLLKSGGVPYTTSILLEFLAPIRELMSQTAQQNVRDELFVGGWLRDLRGVAIGVNSNQAAFGDFVDFLVEHEPYFMAVLDGPVSPLVVVSLLRFLSEVVTTGRFGRVNLAGSAHCVSGVLLFKFLCRLIQRTLGVCITDEQLAMVQQGRVPDGVYRFMLKPLFLSLEIMRKCLHGDFVPFGAMMLYQDDCLETTVVGMLRMLLQFPLSLFREYKKVMFSVVDVLRSLTELGVLAPLVKLGGADLPRVIVFVMEVCADVDTTTPTLLHGMSFLQFFSGLVGQVKSLSRGDNGGDTLSQMDPSIPKSSRKLRLELAALLVPHPSMWSALIHTAMQIVVCQDRGLSLCSSVVFPVFQADSSFWTEFTNEFLASYPQSKQRAIQDALAELASASESQEKFFSEIFLFRSKLRAL